MSEYAPVENESEATVDPAVVMKARLARAKASKGGKKAPSAAIAAARKQAEARAAKGGGKRMSSKEFANSRMAAGSLSA